jgi:integrase
MPTARTFILRFQRPPTGCRSAGHSSMRLMAGNARPGSGPHPLYPSGMRVRRPLSTVLCFLRVFDPLAAKQAARASEAARRTFGQCADDFLKSKSVEWRSGVHDRQWRHALGILCEPIRGIPVDEIDTRVVLSVLQPLWATIPETAARLRGRIEAVLNFAKAHKLRSGENPAAWRGHLALILPKRQKLSRGHYAAVPYRDVPEFIAKLRETDSIPAMALEFLILAAARSGEVLGARWDEFDLAARIWVIPAARMKAGREHRIPLPVRGIEIVERMEGIRSGDFVFPGQRRGQGLGQGALRRICTGAGTVHGFRSAFRDWCSEETSFPREIAEQALAHATGSGSSFHTGAAMRSKSGAS